MNFGEMLTGLYDDLTYQATPAAVITARLTRWINEAHSHALRLSGLVGLRQGTIPFLSRQGQATYGFPQVFERIDAVVEQANDRRLLYRSRDWYRALDPGERSEGTPTVWIDEGLQPVLRHPNYTRVWVWSDNPADTTQVVKIVGVRANGDVQVEASTPLYGLEPVQVGTVADYVRILKWELSAPAAGTVTLFGTMLTHAKILDDFNRPDENPLSFGGKWGWPEAQWNYPLQLISNQAAPTGPAARAEEDREASAAFWKDRVAADFSVFTFIPVLPDAPLPTEFGTTIALHVTVHRPDISADRSGFTLNLSKYTDQVWRLQLWRIDGQADGTWGGQGLGEKVPVDIVNGDAISLDRIGSTFRLNVCHLGVWQAVHQATDSSYYGPLYMNVIISDSAGDVVGAARLDDTGAWPLEGQPQHRILARMPIGRTAVQYQGVRLWPTPSADLTYQVDGQFLIPPLVNPTDVPMLPESYHDMLVCYARFRQYKFNGDETRAMLELAEWQRWLGNLQAYVEYPQDYRPVMGAHTEEGLRWTNLPGGYFPADGWGR